MGIIGLEHHVVDTDRVERTKPERIAEERAVHVGCEVAAWRVGETLADPRIRAVVVPDGVESLQEVRDPPDIALGQAKPEP